MKIKFETIENALAVAGAGVTAWWFYHAIITTVAVVKTGGF